MITVHILCLLVLAKSSAAIDVFLQQPGPGPTHRAQVGIKTRFNCAVIKGYIIEWEIQLPGTKSPAGAITVTNEAVESLSDRGIRVESYTVTRSVLLVDPAVGNNGTSVTCAAFDAGGTSATTRQRSQPVQVVVVNDPYYVSSPNVVGNGANSLRVSWLAGKNATTFTLTATNLNVSIEPTVIPDIQNQFYVFNTESRSACDTYGFQVSTPVAGGGERSSAVVNAVVPSRPNVSLVEETIQHSVSIITASEAIATIEFDGTSLCPSIPNLRFTLVLGRNQQVILRKTLTFDPEAEQAGGELRTELRGLKTNTQYWYSVIVSNRVGDRSTARLTLPTTQVQGINICKHRGNIYTLQCHYIMNASVSGCGYILEGRGSGVPNINGTILRNASDSVQLEILHIENYTNVTVYAEGGEGEDRAVLLRRAIGDIELCVTDRPRPPLTTAEFSVVLAALVLCIILFLFIVEFTYCVRYNREIFDPCRCLCCKLMIFDGTRKTAELPEFTKQYCYDGDEYNWYYRDSGSGISYSQSDYLSVYDGGEYPETDTGMPNFMSYWW